MLIRRSNWSVAKWDAQSAKHPNLFTELLRFIHSTIAEYCDFLAVSSCSYPPSTVLPDSLKRLARRRKSHYFTLHSSFVASDVCSKYMEVLVFILLGVGMLQWCKDNEIILTQTHTHTHAECVCTYIYTYVHTCCVCEWSKGIRPVSDAWCEGVAVSLLHYSKETGRLRGWGSGGRRSWYNTWKRIEFSPRRNPRKV